MACVPRSWVQGLFPTGLVGLSHVPVTLTEKETSPRSWDEHHGGLEHTTLLKPAQITTGVNGQADPVTGPSGCGDRVTTQSKTTSMVFHLIF